jgi:hypothetical protein
VSIPFTVEILPSKHGSQGSSLPSPPSVVSPAISTPGNR